MYIQEQRKTTKIQDSLPAIRDVNTGHIKKGEAVIPKWERCGFL